MSSQVANRLVTTSRTLEPPLVVTSRESIHKRPTCDDMYKCKPVCVVDFVYAHCRVSVLFDKVFEVIHRGPVEWSMCVACEEGKGGQR
jgi:hypothetical protein